MSQLAPPALTSIDSPVSDGTPTAMAETDSSWPIGAAFLRPFATGPNENACRRLLSCASVWVLRIWRAKRLAF